MPIITIISGISRNAEDSWTISKFYQIIVNHKNSHFLTDRGRGWPANWEEPTDFHAPGSTRFQTAVPGDKTNPFGKSYLPSWRSRF